MDIQQYSDTIIVTAPDMGFNADFLHAALGAGTEAGELLDIAKKHLAYGKDHDLTHVKEEIGDVMWYLNLMVVRSGLTWSEVLQANIDKLSVRYPGLVFDPERALKRDCTAERFALEASDA